MVNIGLAGLIVYGTATVSAGILENILVANTPKVIVQPKSQAPAKAMRRKTANDFEEILAVNVFRAARGTVGQPTTGIENKTAAPAQPTNDKLPIQLTLSGTFVMGEVAMAFVIGPDKRTEKIYRLKDCIPQQGEEPNQDCGPGQAKLVAVENDHILVEMSQRRYMVGLNSAELEGGAESVALATQPTTRPQRTERNRPSRGKRERYPSQRKGNQVAVTVPGVEVEEAFANFSNLLNQAQVVPYMSGGQTSGFQIRKIVPNSVFDKLGLTNMDVIKAVNGQSITDADQALRMFTLFRNEREIALEIERRGKPLRFDYTVQ